MPNIRLLLDNNIPIQLVPLLRPHEAVHASRMGWAALSNGDLIHAAQEAGFAAMMTCDRNIAHQQNLSARSLAFIVLTTTHWPTIRDNLALVIEAVDQSGPGLYVVVPLPRPVRRRGLHHPPGAT